MNKSSLIRTWTTSIFLLTITFTHPTYAGLADDLIDSVKSVAENARDRAVEARDAARETRNNVRDTRQEFTSEVREKIEDAVADVKRIIADEREGRDAFIPGGDCGGPCIAFRFDLHDLLTNMEAATNGLVGITSLPVTLQFNNTRDLIENIPGRALYPLYRLLVAENNILNAVSGSMGSIGENLDILKVDQCDAILNNPDSFSIASKSINLASINLKIIGKFLDARGETSLSEGDVGIWGWVHVTVKTNQVKKMGNLLVGLSDALRSVTTFATGKLRYCTMLKDHEDIIAGQQAIINSQALMLQNQTSILSAIEKITPPGRLKK